MATSGHGRPVMKPKATATLAALLVALIAVGVFLGGCTVEYGLDTKVETDGSGIVGVRLAADKELQDALSSAADLGGVGDLGGLGDLGDLENLGDLGDLGGLGILGSILGGLGDTGVFEDLGTLGRILQALGALNDLTGGLPTSVDELFDLILGQIPGEWQVERGTDSSGTRWVSLNRSFSNLEELDQIMSEGVIASLVPMKDFHIYQDAGFFGTKTVFSTSLNPEDALAQAAAESSSLPADLLETVLAIQNRLTLPGEIKDNNADRVEGNTLVWNIGLSDETEMYAESVVRNWGAVIGVTVGAVVVLALIALTALLLVRRRRRKAGTMPLPPPQNGSAAAQATQASEETLGEPDAGGKSPSGALAETSEAREPTAASSAATPDAPPRGPETAEAQQEGIETRSSGPPPRHATPTPIPLRPSRQPAQETGTGVTQGPTDPGDGDGPREPDTK